MRKTKYLACLALLLSTTLASAGPRLIPVYRFEFFGGQTNFDGDTGAFFGNGTWSIAPVVQFSDKTTLIPSYSGALRRTVQVQELVGGALLTQSQQDHNLNLKLIRQLGSSDWKIKGRAGFKRALLRETKDEGWGDGLFDYDKWVTGFEFERSGSKVQSFRTGLDIFALRYPNFNSLSSQQFGTEITAGTDVLDLDAVDWLTSLDMRLWETGYLSLSTLLSPRFYTDAKIIEETGTFSSDKRFDFYNWNAANLNYGFGQGSIFSIPLKNSVAWFTSLAFNDSNQNDFDADQTQFNKNYYSYYEYDAGPRWNAQWGDRLNTGLGYTFRQRFYGDRPVQSATGDYTSSVVEQQFQIWSFSTNYALSKLFTLNANYTYQDVKSNQKFEQTFRYNYDSSHFFLGISFAN